MFSKFTVMLADEDGQGLVEYALVVALVSIVAIAALKMLGHTASNSLSTVANSMSTTP